MFGIAQVTRRADSVMRACRLGGLLVWGLVACSSGGAPSPTAGQDAAMPVTDGGLPADAALSSQDASSMDSGSNDLAMFPPDLALPADLAASVDLSRPTDFAVFVDLARSPDLAAPADLARPTDLATAPDLAFPSAQGVDIYVDNTCKMNVIPKSIDVPGGTTLKLTFHNRSSDYAVTVWMSYGGGYTDLATGGAWPDPIEHCRLPRPYKEYADISTDCSNYRMMINCL